MELYGLYDRISIKLSTPPPHHLPVSEHGWVQSSLWKPFPACYHSHRGQTGEHRRELWVPNPPWQQAPPPRRSGWMTGMKRRTTTAKMAGTWRWARPSVNFRHWLPAVSHDWKGPPHWVVDPSRSAPERWEHLGNNRRGTEFPIVLMIPIPKIIECWLISEVSFFPALYLIIVPWLIKLGFYYYNFELIT